MPNQYSDMIGKIYKVAIDRPIGSVHPKHKTITYGVNYGYIEGIIAGDGEELDVYVLGPDQPAKEITAKIIAIVNRLNDNEDKLVATTLDREYSNEEIKNAIEFQEKYYETKLIR